MLGVRKDIRTNGINMSVDDFVVQKFSPPIIFIILYFIGCSGILDIHSNAENKTNYLKCDGLCIYPTIVEHTADLTYQNFDIENVPLLNKPIISYDDIICYDTTSHIVTLTYSRDSLINKLGQIDVYGNPFLVTLDSSKIYGGWFWTPVSSIPCHWVVIEPNSLFDTLKTNEIRIKLGYPDENEFMGEDPRNNKEIFDSLILDGKVK